MLHPSKLFVMGKAVELETKETMKRFISGNSDLILGVHSSIRVLKKSAISLCSACPFLLPILAHGIWTAFEKKMGMGRKVKGGWADIGVKLRLSTVRS